MEGYNATEIVGKIQDRMAKKQLPSGVTYKFTGEQEEIAKNMEFLSTALIVALALISIIIVAQFNSVTKPMIILSAVILSFIGCYLERLFQDELRGNYDHVRYYIPSWYRGE